MKIVKGDQVFVIRGKDKGAKGKVLQVIPSKNKLIVEGINVKIRNTKPRKQGQKGQRVEVPLPLWISNVKLVCPRCSSPSRIRREVNEGKKFRVCKKCSSSID